jgi:plasmid stabilization system protein ParE
MAVKPVTLHPAAEREYLSSLAWYLDRSPTAASNFQQEFVGAIQRISEAPERWPNYRNNCRRYVLHQFPFSIVYRTFPAQTIVFAVAHAHRRPGYWKNRLKWEQETHNDE